MKTSVGRSWNWFEPRPSFVDYTIFISSVQPLKNANLPVTCVVLRWSLCGGAREREKKDTCPNEPEMSFQRSHEHFFVVW